MLLRSTSKWTVLRMFILGEVAARQDEVCVCTESRLVQLANMDERICGLHSVAIIGAGAAGLVFARVLVRNGFTVTIYEQKAEIGGVWNYEPGSSAMYSSLRTNLPKEIMAISEEDPFPECDHSFLSHHEVQEYLRRFADRYGLLQHIHFATEVTSVRKHASETGQWMVETLQEGGDHSTACFDAVVVCNGHFHVPHTPPLPAGYEEYFTGASYHSNQYDTVKELLRGKNVLVVGSKSSGTDTARELLTIAHKVYVSDRNCNTASPSSAPTCAQAVSTTTSSSTGGDPVSATALPTVLPAIAHVTSDGAFVFADQRTVTDIDAVLWCTGYLYDFPFLSPPSHLECPLAEAVERCSTADCRSGRGPDNESKPPSTHIKTLPGGERPGQPAAVATLVKVENGKRVRPLYQQLFCIHDPTLAFAGLPFRVVPFPLFRFQAEYAAAVFSGRSVLPNVAERFAWLAQFEAKLKQMRYFEEKYHYLGDGDDQWEYCRFLARESGIMRGDRGTNLGDSARDASCSSSSKDRVCEYLRMLQEIYNDNIAHRPACPGAPDTYRERRYLVNWVDYMWAVS